MLPVSLSLYQPPPVAPQNRRYTAAQKMIDMLRHSEKEGQLSAMGQQESERFFTQLKPVDPFFPGHFMVTQADGSWLFIAAQRPDSLLIWADGSERQDIHYELSPVHPFYAFASAAIHNCIMKTRQVMGICTDLLYDPVKVPKSAYLIDSLLYIFSPQSSLPESRMLNALYRLPPEASIADFNRGECHELRYYFFYHRQHYYVELKRQPETDAVTLNLRQAYLTDQLLNPLLYRRTLPPGAQINTTEEQKLLTTPRPVGEFCVGPRLRDNSGIVSNFNHQVTFADGKKAWIVCRHLALQYSRDSETHKRGKVDLLQHYSSKEAISRHVDRVRETEAASLARQRNGSLINSDWFGSLVKQYFDAMKKEGCTHKAFLLYTVDHHVLAARLAIREEEQSHGCRYVVSVYDPNITCLALSSRVNNTSDLLTSTHALGAYSLSQDYAKLSLYGLPILVRPIDGAPLPEISPSLHPPISAAALHLALTLGDAQSVRQYMYKGGPAYEPAFIVLQAASTHGIPGFLMALQEGHVEAVITYITGLGDWCRAGRLSPDNVFDLLHALSPHKCPGLFIAMSAGNARCVAAFIDGIAGIMRNKYLTREQAASLLRSESGEGYPALFNAMEANHNESVDMFFTGMVMLTESGMLSKEQVYDLIRTETASGFPGLFVAMQNNCARTVSSYISGVETLMISGIVTQEQAVTLLRAEMKTGCPGMLKAMESGHTESVNNYIAGVQRLLFAGRLSDEQVLMLLRAQWNTMTGMSAALKSGYIEIAVVMIKGAVEMIAADYFTVEQTATLFFD